MIWQKETGFHTSLKDEFIFIGNKTEGKNYSFFLHFFPTSLLLTRFLDLTEKSITY